MMTNATLNLDMIPEHVVAEVVQAPVAPSNGSRLSCGRNACRRNAVEPQTKRLGGEATQVFPTCERPSASSAC